MSRFDLFHMIKRRAKAAGLPYSTCCHTFRTAGITTYLENGGTLEHAQPSRITNRRELPSSTIGRVRNSPPRKSVESRFDGLYDNQGTLSLEVEADTSNRAPISTWRRLLHHLLSMPPPHRHTVLAKGTCLRSQPIGP
jgi:hypothetical protein